MCLKNNKLIKKLYKEIKKFSFKNELKKKFFLNKLFLNKKICSNKLILKKIGKTTKKTKLFTTNYKFVTTIYFVFVARSNFIKLQQPVIDNL